ncbi:YciI family protein [Psychromicrobium lacuslunae]|uniref:YCII-related domain-containing protein n=1 Tax=Psychromicrobium lacuslunae TaxID=1618207 RepID=A0A0D4C373_9MICC|nr:YciI family protein [Psychromicrobium lacuslunae]AJT43033.1 hypothetical protein UM93_10250 [Psychromicrobium lacuslunae]
MFVISLNYLVELERVDRAIPAHTAWLEENFADGVFLASGRKIPRTGGIILAAGVDRKELDRRLAADPFQTAGIAEYSVTEFEPSKFKTGLSLN